MADETRPRVAVIGGFYDLDADVQAGKAARDYAETLGRTLAEAGFGLVVYFSNDQSLEPHVVRGFVAALPPDESAPRIDVRYSEAQSGQVRFAEQNSRGKPVSRGRRFSGSELGGPVLSLPRGTRQRGRRAADGWGAVHAQCRPGRRGTRITPIGDRQVPRFGTDTPHGVGDADRGVPVLAALDSISVGCLAS